MTSGIFGLAGTPYEPIGQAAQVRYEKAKPEAFLKKLNAFYQTDVENFKKLLRESGFSLFGTYESLKIEQK